MTHDELLARLDLSNEYLIPYEEFEKRNSALRAVVELARKYEEFDGVDSAGMSGYRLAMKQVIQAIEKELN